jgi:oxygen-independent coproporphyrinogen-3 oxidase
MDGLALVLGRERLQGAGVEWTAEANPESFSRDVARGWAGAGVNRVSIGVQSFQNPVLRWLGRSHSREGAVRAVERAREAGISNLNLDLIFGLPEEAGRSWTRDLDSALELEVPHLSLYGLSIEAGTPLSRAVDSGAITPLGEEKFAEQFLHASERLRSEGYLHYEVSNFARAGFECRHNRSCWESAPYLGLGNGAHSFRGLKRRWNPRSWRAYRTACLGGAPWWDSEERLEEEEARLERIWLGLRTDRGIRVGPLNPAARALVTHWVSRGWATRRDDRVRLTPSGWLLLDDLVVDLDLAEEGGASGPTSGL